MDAIQYASSLYRKTDTFLHTVVVLPIMKHGRLIQMLHQRSQQTHRVYWLASVAELAHRYLDGAHSLVFVVQRVKKNIASHLQDHHINAHPYVTSDHGSFHLFQ